VIGRPSLVALALFALGCPGDGSSSEDDGTTGTTGGGESTGGSNLTTSISASDGGTSVSSADESGSTSEGGGSEAGSSSGGGIGFDCVAPTEVPPPCADVELGGPPLLDGWAAGIVVEPTRAALTFSNVESTALLCDEAPLATCDCDGWQSTARFSVLDPLTVQSYSAGEVLLEVATNGDCAAADQYPLSIVTFDITDITEDCVGGQIVIQDGLPGFPPSFWFVAPRC
jgi:hypothetical protein